MIIGIGRKFKNRVSHPHPQISLLSATRTGVAVTTNILVKDIAATCSARAYVRASTSIANAAAACVIERDQDETPQRGGSKRMLF